MECIIFKHEAMRSTSTTARTTPSHNMVMTMRPKYHEHTSTFLPSERMCLAPTQPTQATVTEPTTAAFSHRRHRKQERKGEDGYSSSNMWRRLCFGFLLMLSLLMVLGFAHHPNMDMNLTLLRQADEREEQHPNQNENNNPLVKSLVR